MDPYSVIHSVFELGIAIKNAMSKVKQNKRLLDAVEKEIAAVLAALESLVDQKLDVEKESESELFRAVEDLQSDMTRCLQISQALIPATENQGRAASVKAKLRVWRKRDGIEVSDGTARLRAFEASAAEPFKPDQAEPSQAVYTASRGLGLGTRIFKP
ncbi:hypothetical protein C8J56DRAFT_941832 [Mycena floridula]|nr:hypothetical protein C8J56DRAFT_941832 [Mycena floridula]